MRKIIVMQITRMGDILEGAPLLRAIREYEPNSKITLVVNEVFRTTAELLSDVDDIISFPIFEFARYLKTGEKDIVDLYYQMENFVSKLDNMNYDLALNVTNSRLSGMFMSFIKARQYQGLRYLNSGQREVTGPLIRYFGLNEGIRHYGAFNLSDFMLSIYGPPPINGCLPRIKKIPIGELEADELMSHVKKNIPIIGIQAGASEAIKRWTISLFAKTMKEISDKRDVHFVLLGSNSEFPLAEAIINEFEQFCGFRLSDINITNLVGKTSVWGLASVTRRLSTLITNDTGTMHLTASQGVKVINLSLGSAFFRETAPYGAGNFVLEPIISCRPCDFAKECSHTSCKQLIPTALVTYLTECILDNKLPESFLIPHNGTCDVYITNFDENGILVYSRITPRQFSAYELLRDIYRIVVSSTEFGRDFDDALKYGLKRLYSDATGIIETDIPIINEKRTALLTLLNLAEAGAKLSEQGIELVDMMNYIEKDESMENQYNEILSLLQAIDRSIIEIGHTEEGCRIWTRSFILLKESCQFSQLHVFFRGYLNSYKKLYNCASYSISAIDVVLNKVSANGYFESSV